MAQVSENNFSYSGNTWSRTAIILHLSSETLSTKDSLNLHNCLNESIFSSANWVVVNLPNLITSAIIKESLVSFLVWRI